MLIPAYITDSIKVVLLNMLCLILWTLPVKLLNLEIIVSYGRLIWHELINSYGPALCQYHCMESNWTAKYILTSPYLSVASLLLWHVQGQEMIQSIYKGKGHFVLWYLDDFVSAASREAQAYRAYKVLFDLATYLGLELSLKKCVPPTRILTWLGYTILISSMQINHVKNL